MAAFRDVRDTYLDAWAKAMVEAVNSQAYVKASGTMLDTYLSVSAPFRETTEKVMLQTLQQLSMPAGRFHRCGCTTKIAHTFESKLAGD